jgi:sterol desaturase/sphingolipid hydroxylase (fatty acid hydroxylase superfamily)
MEQTLTVSDPSQLIMGFAIITMALMMVLESIIPRRKLESGIGPRWFSNLSLSVLTWFISTLAKNALLLGLVWWVDLKDFGLLQRFDIGLAGSFVVVLLVSQFISYWTHRIFHQVPVLWRIHAIHHNDTDVDVTTSYRHHPLEPLLPLPLLLPVFMLLGAPLEAALIYQLLLIAISLFSHSNVYIPEKLERFLRRFIITPDFHRNHHSSEQRFTDSNYSSLVPWFDHLFKTASDRPFNEQEGMQLGLEYLRKPRDSRIDQLLLMPFRKWLR